MFINLHAAVKKSPCKCIFLCGSFDEILNRARQNIDIISIVMLCKRCLFLAL